MSFRSTDKIILTNFLGHPQHWIPFSLNSFGLESCYVHSNVLTLSSPFLSHVTDSFCLYNRNLRSAKVREHYILFKEGWYGRKKYWLWSWEVKRKEMLSWVGVSSKMAQLCHSSVNFCCILWLFIDYSKTGRTEEMSVVILQTVRFHVIMWGFFC